MFSLGLCRLCHRKREVRVACGKASYNLHEPETMEEVEAIIAAQMVNRPAWYFRAEERQAEHGPKVAGIRVWRRRMARKELAL
jgi:hypothetical protein